MAATNYTPIQLYHSTTASAVPVNTDLVNGELAINIADGKLYYKDSGGTVQVIATKGAGTIGGSNTQVQYNSSGALAGSANFTFNGTTATINTLNLTNALGAAYGGTAQSTYTQGDLLYASAANTLSKLAIGSNTYILTSNGTIPGWAAPSSISVNTATNLAGGAGGSVPYQSGAGATTFLSIGTANQVMTSSGSLPQWSSGLSITTLTASDAVTFSATTQNIALGTSQTTGTFTVGGAAQTGTQTLDQSTKTHTLNLGTGATESGLTKTINLGTGGVATSTTAINIGSANGTTISLAANPTLSAGTANGVVYLDASKVATSGSALTFDGTNLTLGGASFAKSTVIQSLSGSSAAFAISDNATTTMYANNVSSGVSAIWSSGSLAFGVASGNPFSELMRLTSTGLGIGTSSPASKLTVSRGGSAGIVSNFTDGLAQGLVLTTGTGYFGFYNPNYGAITFRDGGNTIENMRLTDSGNLGLGVTPKTDWSADYDAFQLGSGSSLSGHTSTSLNFTILASNQYVNTAGTSKFINDGYAPRYLQRGDTGEHYWYTTNSGLAGGNVINTQAMTLDASGNLLVGTTSPTYGGQLTVRGAGATVASFMNSNFVAATSGTQLNINAGATTGNTNFQLQVNSGGGLAFNDLALQPSGGNVGIGTSSPAYKLDVTGSANITSFLRVGATPATGGDIRLPNTGIIAGRNAANSSNRVMLQLDSSDRVLLQEGSVVIDSSGNLGLGVAPSAWGSGFSAIDLGGNSRISGSSSMLLANNAFFNGTNWIYKNTATSASYVMPNGGGHQWFTAPSGTAGNAITFTQAMTLDASGNLGLGQTSIAAVGNYTVLNIRGRSNLNGGLIRLETLDGTSGVMRIYQGENDGNIEVLTNDPLIFSTNSTERARITSGGYFKASNSGTYDGSTGAYHEFYQTANDQVLNIRCTSTAFTDSALLIYNDRTTTNGSYNHIACYNGNFTGQFIVKDSGDCQNSNNSYAGTSDIKLKQDIVDAASQWNDIKSLRVRKYRFKDKPNEALQIGVIAQELEQVSPGLVEESADRDAEGNDLGTTTKSVKYSILYMKAVKALQEAMARIEKLEAEVAALKGV